MRILIADDSELIRRAVRGLLSAERECEVCGEACDGVQALQKSLQLRPDVVLLDINMPGSSGLSTVCAIRGALPDAKILIMSLHEASEFLPGALAAGADGCVDKARLVADLVDSINRLQKAPVAVAHSLVC